MVRTARRIRFERFGRTLERARPVGESVVVSGEGQGITEMEQLADLYASFYGAMERLAEETAKYLDNVVTGFRETDEKRAAR